MTPVYNPFVPSINKLKRIPVESNLVYNNGSYEIDFDDFEAKAKESKFLLFSSPHNPLGEV